jgi:hypothetical protein
MHSRRRQLSLQRHRPLPNNTTPLLYKRFENKTKTTFFHKQPTAILFVGPTEIFGYAVILHIILLTKYAAWQASQ